MRQLAFVGAPPPSADPAIQWIYDRLREVMEASAEGIIFEETVDAKATTEDLDAAIATEVAARTAADATLTTNLTAEASARSSADSTLTTNLAAEAATRAAADAALTTAVNGKEPTITAGTTAQYLRGDKSLATFPTIPAESWGFKNKTADQSFTNDATLANLTDLTFPVLANKTYLVRGVILTTAGATGGVKMAFAVPAGFTKFRQQAISTTTTATSPQSIHSGFSGSMVNTTSASSTLMWIIDAVLVNGANAGNMTLQGAQSASNATATTFERGSYLEYYEVP